MTYNGAIDIDAGTHIRADCLEAVVGRVFESLGFSESAARAVARSLVDADAAGVSSHGVMLLPMYVDRVRSGSVSRHENAEIVRDAGATAVLDGRHALGQLTALQAIDLAIDKARAFGIGLVSVRHAFHFGRALPYAQRAADAGLIGIVAANTRPLMPAVGGAVPVIGNNPMAVAVPGGAEKGFGLDMAMSEAALGKIRIAAAEGREIPSTWATDADGVPTTDPAAALRGMLLPVGGPKGFGLALVIEILAGVLSGGATGNRVAPLYADTSVPNDCSHVFLAIDPGFVLGAEEFDAGVDMLARDIRSSKPRAGVTDIMLPGEIEERRTATAVREGIRLEPSVIDALRRIADELGVSSSELQDLVS